MTLNEFLKYVETGKPLKGDEVHQFMNEMSAVSYTHLTLPTTERV